MTNVFKKYVYFYRDDFKLVGILFNHGRSLLNKKSYQEINLPVRIQLSSRSPDLSLERVNAFRTAPLRIFFVSSLSGRCPTETANFLLLLVLSWHYPIMIGGLAAA